VDGEVSQIFVMAAEAAIHDKLLKSEVSAN
jgi:hypothetical protein